MKQHENNNIYYYVHISYALLCPQMEHKVVTRREGRKEKKDEERRMGKGGDGVGGRRGEGDVGKNGISKRSILQGVQGPQRDQNTCDGSKMAR